MKKPNVEYLLLKFLKKQDRKEIHYTIFKMLNNTCYYDIEYLNHVPHDELMIYLEKIIIMGSQYHKIENLEDWITAIVLFSQNKDKFHYADLRRNVLINIKYSRIIMFSRVKKQKKVVRITSLLLAMLIFTSMYFKAVKAKDMDDSFDITDDIIAEDIIENEIDNSIIIDEIIDETSIPLETEEVVETTEEIYKETIPVELSNEEKLKIILENYNLTEEEFNIVCAIAMTEAKVNSYEDTYCVINTIYNRTLSKLWHIDINRIYGEDSGYSLYYQAIAPNQFVVYQNGRYLQYLGVREGDSYQAVIDFLYTQEIKHDFVCFRASNCNVPGSIQFVPGGNNYFDALKLEDRIDIQKSR